MMVSTINALLVVVLVLNLFMLGSSRIGSIIRTVAVQGALLGIMPLLVESHLRFTVLLTVFLAVLFKGVAIPWLLFRALSKSQIRREVEPLIGLLPSMLLGAAVTSLALMFTSNMPRLPEHADLLIAPAAIATVMVGFLLLITRFKAITQVIGYLVLENGIFIFGLLLIEDMPLIVELGVLLDLVVGIFVICIVVNHINRAFSSHDTRNLATLKE